MKLWCLSLSLSLSHYCMASSNGCRESFPWRWSLSAPAFPLQMRPIWLCRLEAVTASEPASMQPPTANRMPTQSRPFTLCLERLIFATTEKVCSEATNMTLLSFFLPTMLLISLTAERGSEATPRKLYVSWLARARLVHMHPRCVVVRHGSASPDEGYVHQFYLSRSRSWILPVAKRPPSSFPYFWEATGASKQL